MIHVALDTNIYRKKPRLDSPEFKALFFLAKSACIRLHVPFFVEMEFKSQIEAEQRKRVESILSNLEKISGFPIIGSVTANLIRANKSLHESKNDIINESGASFISWLNEIDAARYEISVQETAEALSAYFHGKAPFKEPKVRNDIPDSFIYQSLLNIHASNSLHFVCEDAKLREACELAGIICYKDLAMFIASKEIKTLIQGKIDNNVLGALKSQIVDFIKNQSSMILDKIEKKLLSDEYSTISGDGIPGESNEIYLSGINKPHQLNVSDDIEHYGDAIFLVEFSAKVEFLYEYTVHRSDAYDFDSKKYHLEYLNDHYVDVETTDEFTFNGRIELNYDIDLESIGSVEELLKKLSDPKVSIEELDDFEMITQ